MDRSEIHGFTWFMFGFGLATIIVTAFLTFGDVWIRRTDVIESGHAEWYIKGHGQLWRWKECSSCVPESKSSE